jgi:hypothetical protein
LPPDGHSDLIDPGARQAALFYRPWQYYSILISAQEYGITDKLYFGTDSPSRRSRNRSMAC